MWDSPFNPISGRGGGVIHPSGFRRYLVNGWIYDAEICLTFPWTKLGTFSENFKLIDLPGAAPRHRELGGPIREASRLGEDHNADVL